ncbi:MAG: SDR family NAD(P)-dependent oxidoreductase [bacterium]|nr:SDR family NAD(P)-dependent oxidoreductase [Candidatus Minthenecus merdequi]
MGFAERLKKMLNMSNDDGNRIIITGALGYIGSHTAVELIEAGFEVCLVDNLSCTNIEVLEGIEKITDVKPIYENIDCKDYVAMDKFMNKVGGIKAVIHCAALKNEENSDSNPLAYYRNNIGSLVTLLELLPVHKINCLVCSVPMAANQDSVYHSSLLMCERIINDSMKVNHDLYCTIVHHATAIGAHPTSLVGFNGERGDLQIDISRAAAGKCENVAVYENHIREYIDIMDIAKTHRHIIENIGSQKDRMLKQNLGSGCCLSDIEFVKLFEQINNVRISMDVRVPENNSEQQVVSSNGANSEKLKEAIKNIWRWQLHLGDIESDGKQKSGHLLGGS